MTINRLMTAISCLCGTLGHLRDDRRAATAVEFGLIALPLLSMIGAIFEIGYVDFESEMLSAAVTKASRAMLTGQAQGANVSTATQFINTYLCPSTGNRLIPSNFNCSLLIVDVRTATSFTSGDMTKDIYTSSNNEFCPGAPGQIVVMRVAYPLAAIFPFSLGSTAGVVNNVPNMSGLYHILMATALFEEENYAYSYTTPSGC